ncbi:MAG: hypothetical protein EA356_05610 [Geminicoccaceae bacterium]|nr:MAG: hypothetical protein EA356_05610 [Geminicoccaceae bacterium]
MPAEPDAAAVVPVALLAHALRTPLNLVEGNALLLATGAAGPLDDVARQALLDLRLAAHGLTRVLGLLEQSARGLPPFDGAAAAPVALCRLADRVVRPFGWQPLAAAAPPAWVAGWAGWEPLLQLSLAALDERGTSRLHLELDATSGHLDVRAEPYAAGSGDTALGAWLAERMARAAGLRVCGAVPGRLRWRGPFARHGAMMRSWCR